VDKDETDAKEKKASRRQRPRPPGLVSAWVSGAIVCVLSAGILVVVFCAIGRTPWPTENASPAGAGRFEWLLMALLIGFLAFLAGRSAFRSTLRFEAKRRDKQRP
jgi:hypothetical protein